MSFLKDIYDDFTGRGAAKKQQQYQQEIAFQQAQQNIFHARSARVQSRLALAKSLYELRAARFQRAYARQLEKQMGQQRIASLRGQALQFDIKASSDALSTRTVEERAREAVEAHAIQSNVRLGGKEREQIKAAGDRARAAIKQQAGAAKWPILQQVENTLQQLDQQGINYQYSTSLTNAARKQLVQTGRLNELLHDMAIDMASAPVPTIPYTGPSFIGGLLQIATTVYSAYSVFQGLGNLFTGGTQAAASGGHFLKPGVYGPQ